MRQLITIIILLLLTASLFPRCANIVSPTGGPKDTLPPVLISASPPDSSLNFSDKQIEFEFDEYVQLDNSLNDILIVSPTPKRMPQIRSKLRTVTVQIKDTLQPNTTYTINMGNAIKDLNEGNPINNFRYVFSTGNYLDSLQISGSLHYAQTGDPDSMVDVMLYRDLSDSVVSLQKPVYYTRSDSSGHFYFNNLPHGTFKMFALKDQNKDLLYDDSTEAIAFVDSTINLDHNIDGFHLLLFNEKMASKPSSLVPPLPKDSLPPFSISALLDNGKQDITQPLHLLSSHLLQSYDSTKFTLQEDTLYHHVQPSFSLDSTQRLLALTYKWKENMPYRLLLQENALKDTAGKTLAADTIKFTTKGPADYSSIELDFNGLDSSQHYVVQMAQQGDIKYSGPVINSHFSKKMVTPGEYTIRVLIDQNNNGKWDNGSYYGKVKKQPERVITMPNTIKLRSNWENKQQINFTP